MIRRAYKKKSVKILTAIVLVVFLLVEFNFALGIDFRLRNKLRSWNEAADADVYFAWDNNLNIMGQKYDFTEFGSVDAGDHKVYLYQCETVCADGNNVYFINYYTNHYELMSFNTADKTFSSHFVKCFKDPTYYLAFAEGIKPGYQTPFQSYYQTIGDGGYAVCFYYDGEIVIQNGVEAVIFDTADSSLTEKDGIYCPNSMYDGLEVYEESITVTRSNGEKNTLTLGDMAQLDETANELYKMSRHRTSIFGPKINVQFKRAGYYDDSVFIAMVVRDSGGWAHLIYYLYYPESNELEFLHWENILDEANEKDVHLVMSCR